MLLETIPFSVRAELVEALYFSWLYQSRQGQPFDTLRASGSVAHV